MGDLRITLDPDASGPSYEQVRAQLAALIEQGVLAEGDHLPTVRAMAGDLGLAVNTVARAYKELETEGLVTTGRRAGTVVAGGGHATDTALRRSAVAFAADATRAGLSEAAALDLVRAALREART
ncbi:GntR family transcriptional regulator [Knoellia aerolata]|uniref:GntR family transcriptional regulator n=1 Tax=Knoellia aerolata DSM 18566 TaxID=1385519 RepID=A0A0A0K1C9_9MICO|nr:GntR family transcriptional regulator [Knoellia aerolata]KGN41581.1 GntR family transcriptional regulator [Knoellia aerolata DSM 18566]